MSQAITQGMELAAISGILDKYDLPDETLHRLLVLAEAIQTSCNGEECSAEDVMEYLFNKYGV